jgi:hypothetical protein
LLQTSGKASTWVILGKLLPQFFSFYECLRSLHFLSLISQPELQLQVPRSSQTQPSLGARSKRPNGFVTVSAMQTQTGTDNSVPFRDRKDDGEMVVVSLSNILHVRWAGEPTANGVGILLAEPQQLWLQKLSS